MGKTKKERTLEAHRLLINKYELVLQEISFHFNDTIITDFIRNDIGLSMAVEDCPLCHIHFIKDGNCKGCPLANRLGNIGCIGFSSYSAIIMSTHISELKKALKRRILFHKTALISLKYKPERFFTKSGWEYFSELDRNW